MTDFEGSEMLRISIVTPNFNGGQFLERTIESVLGQNYPNLNYIIVDGGSTDGSLDVIDRYRQHLSHVVIESDRGHSHALNKGFALATGTIMGWINSDDILLPGSLTAVDRVFREVPGAEWITGRASTLSEDGFLWNISQARPWSWLRFVMQDCRHIQQESSFWRRDLWSRVGGMLDEDYGIAGDFELWTRFLTEARLLTVNLALGAFRFRSGGQLSRPDNQGLAPEYEEQTERALRKLGQMVPMQWIVGCTDVLKANPPIQPSSRYDEVDRSLGRLDPPILRYDRPTNTFMFTSDPDLERHFPKVASESITWCNLDFRVTDRVRISDLMDLTKYRVDRFVGLEVLLGDSESEPHDGSFSGTSPSMPLVIGPVAVYDFGRGTFRVDLRHGDGVTSIPVQIGNDEDTLQLRLAAVGLRYALFANGLVVGAGTLAEPLEDSVFDASTVGGGFRERGWRGVIRQLRIWWMPTGDRTDFQSIDIRHAPPPSKAHSLGRKATLSDTDLASFRNVGLGQRIFLMGGGPSLNGIDLNRLNGDTVFACNGAFLLFPRLTWRPKFYTCVDSRVLVDRAHDINGMLSAHPKMEAFFPSKGLIHDGSLREFDTRRLIRPAPSRHYFNEVPNEVTVSVDTMFSRDVAEYVVQPYTVAITMLQLAAYMGFSPIYLIGMDLSYSIPSTTVSEGRKVDGTGLLLTSTQDDDPNHFDPRYFGAGRAWHHPQVDKMIMHFEWAKVALEESGIEIFNATPESRLEVFPKVNFDDLF